MAKKCKKCPNVWVDDGVLICPKCKGSDFVNTEDYLSGFSSSPLDYEEPSLSDPAPKPKHRKLGIIVTLAISAIVLITVIVSNVPTLFAVTPLTDAAENSIASLVDQLGDQNDLLSYMENMNSLDAKSDRHFLLSVKTPDVFLALDTDYAGSKKRMEGAFQFQYLHDSTNLSMNFHADQNELRIFAPELVSDIYGFKYKDFEKNYNDSQLRKLLNLPSFENLKFSPFQRFDLMDYLKTQGGESWIAFTDSLKIEEFGTRQLTLGNRSETCTVYRIKWDAQKAAHLIHTIGSKTLGVLPDFVVDLATNLSSDVRCYVNAKEILMGVEFTFLNSIYTILLEGEQNPWEQVSLKIVTAGFGDRTYSGGVVTDAECTRIELKDHSKTVYAIYHYHDTHAYSIVSPDGELANGIFRSDNSGFYLEINFRDFSSIISVSDLATLPEKSDEKYIDLTNLSLSESSRLMTELCNSLNITLEAFWELIATLFRDLI